MTGITQSFSTYLDHTGKYYSRLLAPKSVRVALAATIMLIMLLTIATSAVTTHAGVAQWVLDDVLNKSIMDASFDFVHDANAPPLSDNKYHLQMPMMFEGFMSEDVYVSGGTSDPSNPKLDDSLEMTMQESYFNLSEFEIADKSEWDAAAGDATEFVENRPPQSGLK